MGRATGDWVVWIGDWGPAVGRESVWLALVFDIWLQICNLPAPHEE